MQTTVATKRGSDRKADTRQRILDAAGALFRAQGVDAVGVDAIMRAAGLTHGGFYAHFASKEALVAEVAAASLGRAAERWMRIACEQAPHSALERIVSSYLDPAHVTEPDHGCVLTTLGPEVARRPVSRRAITDAVGTMVEALTRCMPAAQGKQALAALSTLVGSVVLARLADDPALAKAFLQAASDSVLDPDRSEATINNP